MNARLEGHASKPNAGFLWHIFGSRSRFCLTEKVNSGSRGQREPEIP
jgi:hypothetical protein